MHIRIVLHLLAAALVAVLAGWSVTAQEVERIDDYRVQITVRDGSDLAVTETINIFSTGEQIKHGIVRNFPKYYFREERKIPYDYRIEGAYLNGAPVAHEVHNETDSVKIRIGDANSLLSRGSHTFELRYNATDQVLHLSDSDEVYWNVIPTKWSFPIMAASASVTLPLGSKVTSATAYTGKQGGRGKDYLYQQADDTQTFKMTRALPPGEGMTVSVRFQQPIEGAAQEGQPGATANQNAIVAELRKTYGDDDDRLELIADNADYAVLAWAAYEDPDALSYARLNGWSPLKSFGLPTAPWLGEAAATLFVSKDGNHVLAFRGTKAKRDWVTNIGGSLAMYESSRLYAQAKAAVEIAKEASSEYPDLVIVGHSLGGRLAQVAALETGKKAVVFDRAPFGTVEILKWPGLATATPSSIERFRGGADPLTAVNPFARDDIAIRNIVRSDDGKDYLYGHNMNLLALAMQDVRIAWENGWLETQDTPASSAAEDHVLKGGILRRGISGRVDTVDPHRSSTPWENIVIGDMFVGLVDVTPDGKVIPGVAKVWTHDKTGLVWTFNLRNDVTWSDGVPLTAHDFVYAFRRLQNPATASMFSSLLYVIKNAQQVNNGEAAPEKLGVRAVDDHTLEISLTERVPYLPELLSHQYAYPVPQRIVEKYGDNEWVAPKNIVVNGPYKLVYWRSGDQLVTEKNPNFWGSESLCYDRVAYFEIEDNKLVEERIDSGELDINNSFDGVRTAELRQRYPGWVRTSPSLFTTYWSFNQTKPPFDDVRVRHALTMALDRDFIVENILSPGYSPAYSFVPPTISNYETDRPRFRWTSLSRKERLKKAKDLLLEAGYGPDNPLTFEYIFRSTGENPKVASVAQSNWNEIAPWVDAQISSAKPIVLYGRLRQNDFEIADGAWKADINDPISFLHLLNSRIGSQNYGNYNNPEYDNLLKSAALKTDLKHRAELFARAEQLMLDDAGVSPMWFGFTENLASPQITGWSEHPMDIHRSRWMCRVNPHEN